MISDINTEKWLNAIKSELTHALQLSLDLSESINRYSIYWIQMNLQKEDRFRWIGKDL